MNEPTSRPPGPASFPPPGRRALAALASVALGLATAVMLHYLLYRVGLPSRPFIYVAF